MRAIIVGFILLFCGLTQGQSLLKPLSERQPSSRYNKIEKAFYFSVNIEEIDSLVKKSGCITLPNGTQGTELFQLINSQTLSPALQKQYPSILSFSGYAVANANKKIRIDFNEKGLFAWVTSPTESYFIHSLENKNELILFDEVSYKTAYKQTFNEHEPQKSLEVASRPAVKTRRAQKATGEKLRTYRLAVSCTGEYAAYHGGTKTLALAAIASTINRINEVFEKDLAIRLELIPNMGAVLFTNAATDPYVDNDSDQMIDEVQVQLDQLIGEANYDIGHVFSTGGGGLAQLASVCGSLKGGGVTGSSNPIGDPFDIDYVAHELGHQFGAEHTFNSNKDNCSDTGWEFAAYEPGSGTTIMGYAGICAPDNIQQQSDAYFHTHSIDEIVTYINGKGGTCGTATPLNNTPPTVTVPEGGGFIPISTPFQLTGSATDNEDSDLTYCWEEYDLGSFGSPTSPQGNAPIFRSFTPTTTPTRYFPKLEDVVTNQSTFGELLPTYSRDLTFRLTVRDNRSGGGGVNDAQVAFKSTNQAGPFLVTSQNTATSYEVNETTAITWDVANTNISPVNCSFVRVLLSTDGGYNYPIILTENTPNDGQESVTIPNYLTTQGRIKVEAMDNVFYNINTTDFTIVAPATPNFALNIMQPFQDVCLPDSFVYPITLTRFTDFDEVVNLSLTNLPNGLSYYFTDDKLHDGESAELVLKVQNGHQPSDYEVNVLATSTNLSRAQKIKLRTHVASQPNVGVTVFPENEALAVGLRPVFKWNVFEDADMYSLELSKTNSFDIKETYQNITLTEWLYENTLLSNTTYYWRVKGANNCGISNYSQTSQFTTAETVCQTIKNNTKVLLLNGTKLFSSTITSPLAGLVTQVNIKSIKGTHEHTSDLVFYLEAPSNKRVTLLSDVCDGYFGEDFNLGFDDNATNGFPLCPPTDGLIHLPAAALSDFVGENAQGNWMLYIRDDFEYIDAGTLQSWELEICAANALTALDVEVKNRVYAFPNPTNGKIEFKGLFGENTVKIYNGFGQLVGQSTENIFETTELNAGVYFYVFVQQGKQQRGKFVKM